MTPADGGWWEIDVDSAAPGDRYQFRLDDGEPRSDPRALWLPDGPERPGAVFDVDALDWTDELWRGPSLPGAIVYELHVGTFTPDGTLDAAIERLDHLVDLGVDLVEV